MALQQQLPIFLTILVMIYPFQNLQLSSCAEVQYPTLMVPCKYYKNKTNLDCSRRLLDEIPSLDDNLMTILDLSLNELTQIKGMPFKKLSALRNLDLRHNKISNISHTAFTGVNNLQCLQLSHNYLKTFSDGTFTNLKHLIFLDFTKTFFAHLPRNEEFVPLQSLRNLSIVSSSLISLRIGKSFGNLTSLRRLVLNAENLRTNISRDTFHHLAGLMIQSLDLQWTSFGRDVFIEPETILPLTNLQELTILYDAVLRFKFYPSPLQVLDLHSGKQSPQPLDASYVKPITQWNTTLSTLIMSGFPFLEILDYTFQWVPYLKRLDLSTNSIKYVSDRAFYGIHFLDELTLAFNYLTQIPSASLAALSGLKKLDLSSNQITDITHDIFITLSSLNNLNLGGNQIVQIGNWTHYLTNLKELVLDDRTSSLNIAKLFYTNISSLQVLFVKDADSILFVSPSFDYRTMCDLFPNLTQAILASTNTFGGIAGFPEFLGLNKCPYLVELDISGSITSWYFNNESISLPSLRSLNMASNEMTSVHQMLFIRANLTSLDLSHNRIQVIEGDVFTSYPGLNALNLEANLLVVIDGIQYLPLLRYLNLAGNQITQIPDWLFSRTNYATVLEELELDFNPFRCNCSIQAFREWILTDTTTHLPYLSEYRCDLPEELTDLHVTAIELDCKSNIGFYVSVGIPCTLMALVLLTLLIKYRWHIKYRLHLLLRRYRPFPHINGDNIEMLEQNGAIRFHAYVAYNDDSRCDEAWVRNDLQPNIEEGPEPFQLCIKSRDFIPGQPLIETISEKIQQSRKTILVLTPQFVESEWCYHEMEMAQMLLFQEERDVLVLVMLEDIPERKITISLRKLLCKKQYLKWPKNRIGQRLFWQKLREELKTRAHIDRRCDF